MRFEVWAPHAESVELQLPGRRCAMQRDRSHWFRLDAEVDSSADYGFCLDGRDPLPDPRSPWQPRGVHGLSRTVDHSLFSWTDQRWQAPPLSAALVYELHIGTFTPEGTFEAAISKLDHLVELGVTHVELMPVADFPGARGWGYDGVALYAPRHLYGGPLGLKRLVNACHAKGLAVVLDVVYNHLGPLGNYLGQFGPYFNPRHQTPWGSAINTDGAGSDEVRRFIVDNARMWLKDYHIDGLRLDAVHAIIDTSAIHLLEQLAHEVEVLSAHLGRHLVLIAESDLNDPRIVRSREAGGYGLDAQWNDDFHHAVHALLAGERSGYYEDFGLVSHLAEVLERPFLYEGSYSQFRRRHHGRPALALPGSRFVAYLQNHDQVGNRAQGERSSQLLSLGRQKIGAALVHLSPYVPMLFQGEEWGSTSPFQYFVDFSEEPPLAEAVGKGRRHEFVAFGWREEDVPDPQDPQTFQRSRLDWSQANQSPHAELLHWHQQLRRLRRQHSSLSDGDLSAVSIEFAESPPWLLLKRKEILVALNLHAATQSIPLGSAGRHKLLLASDPVVVGENSIELPPDSVAVIQREE